MEENTLQKLIKQSKLELAEKKKKTIDEAWEIVNSGNYFPELKVNIGRAIEFTYEQGLADGMEVTTFN